LPAIENIAHIERDGARLRDPHGIRSQPGQHLSRYVGGRLRVGCGFPDVPRVVVGSLSAVEQRGVDIPEALVAAERAHTHGHEHGHEHET
jgi:hypothetical protein